MDTTAKKTYKPMRTYTSSHRMAKRYARMYKEETGRGISLIEAVDLALFQAIQMCKHFDYDQRFEQEHPGFDNAK